MCPKFKVNMSLYFSIHNLSRLSTIPPKHFWVSMPLSRINSHDTHHSLKLSHSFLLNYICLFSCSGSKKNSLSMLYDDLYCWELNLISLSWIYHDLYNLVLGFNISSWFSRFPNWNILYLFFCGWKFCSKHFW